jgi:hypothetical protein
MAMRIVIKNDDEGFLGNAGSDEISKIDFDASLADYEKRLTAAVNDWYPTAEIEHDYAPYSGKSIYISDCPDDLDENQVSEDVQELGGRIYDAGLFWRNKLQ